MPASSPRNHLPIGVFDSGVGGLTVLSALRRALPSEDLLYLGDTARVPYGTRSAATVRTYSRRVAAHLWREGIKALVIACNTATTYALGDLQAAGARAGVPVIGVIEPGVRAALSRTQRGDVAVLGTEGTIRGGRYQEALEGRVGRVRAVACPLFVPLAEEGWIDGEVARLVAERYLGGLAGDDGPDTVILGCTHYPVLKHIIAGVLPAAALVDSAEATAVMTAEVLASAGLLNPRADAGGERFLVTDHVERFRTTGRVFLEREPQQVELVDLLTPILQHGVFAEGA